MVRLASFWRSAMTYDNEMAIQAVVEGFETCETAGDGFTHADHLAVGAWYLRYNTELAALEKMRRGLLRFLTYHGEGVQKYNETITLFWLKRVDAYLASLAEELTWYDRVNRMVEALGNSKLVFEYYSPELLQSKEAKGSWVEPDLKPLGS